MVMKISMIISISFKVINAYEIIKASVIQNINMKIILRHLQGEGEADREREKGRAVN